MCVNCCNLFECDLTFSKYGCEEDFNATEVLPALDIDVFHIYGADGYEPGREDYHFKTPDSDKSSYRSIDWEENSLVIIAKKSKV